MASAAARVGKATRRHTIATSRRPRPCRQADGTAPSTGGGMRHVRLGCHLAPRPRMTSALVWPPVTYAATRRASGPRGGSQGRCLVRLLEWANKNAVQGHPVAEEGDAEKRQNHLQYADTKKGGRLARVKNHSHLDLRKNPVIGAIKIPSAAPGRSYKGRRTAPLDAKSERRRHDADGPCPDESVKETGEVPFYRLIQCLCFHLI